MGGRKLGLKVQASTILEVVISMVVIIVVFGVAMMIFGNVTRLSLSAKKLKAASVLQERLALIEHDGANISNDTINSGDLLIGQGIKAYDGNERLHLVTLVAYDLNYQKLAELKKIIISHE